MAYYDFDGKITIDESAAERDILYIQVAKEILERAKNDVDRMATQAAEAQGEAAVALQEKAAEFEFSHF